MNPVKAALDVLCQQYARNGEPYRLNDVQAVLYLEELSRFPASQLEYATREWIRQSKFFPTVADLLGIMEPPPDWPALSNLAWSLVCKAIRTVGYSSNVTFTDASIGEAVRQTFGTWEAACSFDSDSPGFAIRRQTFLAIFPAIHDTWQDEDPVTLPSSFGSVGGFKTVPALYGLPKTTGKPYRLPAVQPVSRVEANNILADITVRAKGLTRLPTT